MLPDLQMRLVTGQHCITPQVQEKMDELMRDPEYQQFFSAHYTEFNNLVVQNTWEAEPYILYSRDIPVGMAKPSFDRANNKVTNILPRIFKPYRRQGLGGFIFQWAFEKYFNEGFDKICTVVWSNNKPSLALNRKFFTEEAILKQHQLINGRRYDTHLFGMLAPEYRARKLLR